MCCLDSNRSRLGEAGTYVHECVSMCVCMYVCMYVYVCMWVCMCCLYFIDACLSHFSFPLFYSLLFSSILSSLIFSPHFSSLLFSPHFSSLLLFYFILSFHMPEYLFLLLSSVPILSSSPLSLYFFPLLFFFLFSFFSSPSVAYLTISPIPSSQSFFFLFLFAFHSILFHLIVHYFITSYPILSYDNHCIVGACEALARSLIKANKSIELSCWVNRAIGHLAAGHEANRDKLGTYMLHTCYCCYNFNNSYSNFNDWYC